MAFKASVQVSASSLHRPFPRGKRIHGVGGSWLRWMSVMSPVSFFVMRKRGFGTFAASDVLPQPCTACKSTWSGRGFAGVEATMSLGSRTGSGIARRFPPGRKGGVEEAAEREGFGLFEGADAEDVAVVVLPSAGGKGGESGVGKELGAVIS